AMFGGSLPAVRESSQSAPSEYLRIAEVAARLRLSVKSVRNKMYEGTLRKGVHWFSPPGIGPRFRSSAIVAWLEGRDPTAAAGVPSGSAPVGAPQGRAYLDIPRDRPHPPRRILRCVDRPQLCGVGR